jgi:hypothetical protein
MMSFIMWQKLTARMTETAVFSAFISGLDVMLAMILSPTAIDKGRHPVPALQDSVYRA